MQRIRYVNLRGETVEFGREKPLILAHVEGTGATEAQIASIKAAYQSGESLTRMQRGARVVDVQYSLMPDSDTREAMYRARMEVDTRLSISRCMDAQGNMGRLHYENDAGSWWTYAVPEGEGARYGTRWRNVLPSGRISFRSGSAYWRSTAEHEVRLEMGAGGFRLPFRFPIRFGTAAFSANARNDGGAPSPVRITIDGTGERPTLRNNTTGAEMSVERTIATGEQLEINTDPERLECVHILTDGTREDAWGYLSAGSAIADFVLMPGDNEIVYSPSQAAGASRIRIRWNALYEGV